jgi:hypothetical protein
MTLFQTALEAMTVTEMDNKEVLWHGPVRFERSSGKFDQKAIDLPKFLLELCSALSAFDEHFLFRDKNGNTLSMDSLPATQEACEQLFNYQVVEKRSVRQMLFVADMISSQSMGQLKNAAWSILKKFGIWMFRHELAVNRLDVNNSGWLLGAHPRYHSPDLQRKLIKQGLENWWTTLTPTVQTTWDKKLSRFKRHQSKFPDFYVQVRNVRGDYSGVTSTTSAFNIVTAVEDTRIIDELLQIAFPPDSDPTNGTYIPMGLRRSNANHFLRLVHRQQEYLDAFQVVSVAGLTTEIMNSQMTLTTSTGQELALSVQAAFMMNPSIQRIDPGSFLLRLGKWHVSTTKDKAEDARAWVDKVILAMPASLRDNETYESFPTATRMKANPAPAPSGYATLAGDYSVQTLSDHQKSREKPVAPNPYSNKRTAYHNPQESESYPMATFTSQPRYVPHPLDTSPMSYAACAAAPRKPKSPDNPSGYKDYTVSPWVSDQILALKATIAAIQQPPVSTITSPDNPNQDTTTSPDFMMMFQQIQQGMQASRTQLTEFRSSMESRVQIMDSNIQDLNQKQGRMQKTAINFQTHIQAEITALRAANATLNTRIDDLADVNHRTPVPSPRRKKPHRGTPQTTTQPTPGTPETKTTATSVSTRLDDDDHSHDYFEDSDDDTDMEDDLLMEPPQPTNVSQLNDGSNTQDQEPAFPADHN